MRRKTLLTAVIIAVALVGCNKAGAEVPPTTEEKLASTSIEETSYTKTVEEITSTEEVATTTTIAPTEPTIMKETTSTSEEIVPTTIEEKTTSTKEVTSTEVQTTTVAPTETSGEGIIEAETSTKEPEKNTTVATTTVAPTTTEAPTTTVAPVITEAPHSHNYTSTVTKTATCTEEGIVTYTCSCGSSYTESVPTLSHSYGEYTYNNDATTENDGTKTATCALCGATDTITAEGTKITEHTHQYNSYSEGTYGRATCTVCGKTAWVHLPLPTENCPYTLNTKIYNDDGTISFYYVDSSATDSKYGYADGGAGNRAHNDFSNWCELNYYDVIGDDDIGDYAEGVVSRLTAKPY